ncbi:hypothetical protein KM295_04380 [Natronomonas sp. F2-12]|jgi:uncharacterized CHY-type Zn-finger protein|uniref:CHY-type domain-containing protein n=1 Tax=Natronomonas aquatica TaxID=2841590 RepID=A0A9R1D727_9EURY|nr:CHY zinc finger protein [Natronomonas aquatica]MCQ4332740.1 hypothetical protein [Natronomonas aquatica]
MSEAGEVRGVDVDDETRCAHYDSESDVVAIRFGCCGTYYACFECHAALADHPPEPWPTARRTEPAARCGVCGADLTATEYTSTDACPNCEARFNPGCAEHYHLYFEWIDAADSD